MFHPDRLFIDRLFPMFIVTTLLIGACTSTMTLAAGPAGLADNRPFTTHQPVEPPLKLLGHVAGPLVTVAAQGDLVYMGHSFELAVVDVTDASRPRLVASLPIPASSIALTGDYVMVGGRRGLSLVGAADPSNPRQVSDLTYPDILSGVATAGQLAVVIERHFLHVIDLSQPEQMREIGALRLPDLLESVTLRADRAYVTDHRGVQIVDLHDPHQPALLESIATTVGPSQVAFDGGAGYFASGGYLYRFDAAEPGNIARLNETAFSYWVRTLTVRDGLAYLSAGSGGLRIWDVGSGGAAHEVGVYQTAGLALDARLARPTLYLADCDDGLRVLV